MLADINAEAVGLGHMNSDYVLFTTDCFQALFSTINLCVKLSGLLVLIGSYFLFRKPRKIWERQIKPIDGYRYTAPWLGLPDCLRSRNDLYFVPACKWYLLTNNFNFYMTVLWIWIIWLAILFLLLQKNDGNFDFEVQRPGTQKGFFPFTALEVKNK